MPDPTKPFPPAEDPWGGRAAVPRPFPEQAQIGSAPTGPTVPAGPTVPTGPPVPAGPPRPPRPAGPTVPVGPQVVFVEVRRKPVWPWVLGIFVLLTLLCCGLCGIIIAPLFGEFPSSVAATPSEVNGFKRDDNAVVQLVAAEANFRLRASDHVDGSFVNRFEDPRNKQRNIIAFGGTGLIWDPEGTLKAIITGAGENLWNVKDFPPGKHGGLFKCGDGKDDKATQTVVCAWIDHGSLGIGVFYGRIAMADCASFLRALRESVIIRP